MAVLIDDITSRQIIDSRGIPTLETEVVLSNGIKGCASVPSGASVGKREALELRDNNPKYLFSKGVLKAICNVNKIISKELRGMSPFNQYEIDSILEKIDSTSNFSKIGANAALSVSMAVMCAAANALGLELFQYIGGKNAIQMPIPMINVINGGKHSDNRLKFQEFMIVPYGMGSFSDAIIASLEIFQMLKMILKKKNLSTTVGDEGGFAPPINNNIEALELLVEAIDKSGYSLNNEVGIALDVAASEFYADGRYKFDGERLSSIEMIEYLTILCTRYPIISIEDPLSQDDFNGWREITKRLNCMLVGDDLFTTNPKSLKQGIDNKLANSILIKPNQIGTITKTLECSRIARDNCYKTIISHRSGETESTFIADLAVGLNSGFIKTGSMSRSERTAKYNRLLKIEQLLKKSAAYYFK